MMFNINLKKFNLITALLLAVTIIWTAPTLSQEFINATTSKQVSAEYKKQVDCLAETIYYESGSESYEGKLSVAQIILNRVNNPKYPKDICSVVYQKYNGIYQFSWIGLVTNKSVKNKYQWEESLLIANKALTEPYLHDLIYKTKSLYYHAVYVNPGWKLKRTTQIGNHIFYSDI